MGTIVSRRLPNIAHHYGSGSSTSRKEERHGPAREFWEWFDNNKNNKMKREKGLEVKVATTGGNEHWLANPSATLLFQF